MKRPICDCDYTQIDFVDVYNKSQGKLTGYDCPKCLNKGVIYYSKDGEIMCHECDCMKVRKSIKRIERSGLKESLKRYTFDKYTATMDYQKWLKSKAMKYARSPTGWFFAGGQVGCGKTHICTAIVSEFLVGQERETRYLQWRDDVPRIKAHVNDEKYDGLINPFKYADVLYIDDMYKTKVGQEPTAADVAVAFEILNYRYQNPDLITIISSERLIGEIIDIDEAVGSRIYEMSGEYCLNITRDKSKNYRLGRASII